MPKSDNQKLKILYILDHLERNSHADRYVNANELINMLAKHNISCDRKTIYSDVAFTVNGDYYIQKGENHLNGQQALGFARIRKSLAGGDNDRGKNQMKLITAILNQLSAGNLLQNYDQILKSLEGMFVTSMPAEKIGELVQKQLTEMPKWEIFSFAVTGQGGSDSCWAAGGGYAYVMYPHEDVVAHASALLEKVLTGEVLVQDDLTMTK